MSSTSAEHRRLHASYRTRGRQTDSVRWAESHLAGSAVVVETGTSAYVFVPVYLGKEYLSVPGGAFRMACFTLDSDDENPEVLVSRPFDVAVGEELWFALAEDQRRTSDGLVVGEMTIDLTKQYPTSPVEAIYVVLADPGSPEF